ncbi:50S ribosomal protein L9 [Baekduia sp. Peel2402]|jgi:large subunit ribosomal protein L9|uniref:50S ribosomal protein L9 n=1 Tax=Baekduia sp. Peel2402 TaxID=3458296 RepID=UPI00403EE008
MPEAILLKDVDGVGSRGAVVDVSKGYLRNFLIPRKLAAPASKGLLREAERNQDAYNKATATRIAQAQEQAEQLNKTVLTIAQQAGEDGRLFGSVTNQDIAEAIKEARGIEVDRRKIKLDEPIKNVGTYQVELEIAEGVTASVKVMVSEA